MAFPSVAETKAKSKLTMDPPINVKPPHQPLHNFTLKGLKWSLNNSANHQHYHRVRKPGGESSRKPPRNLGSVERSEVKEKKLSAVFDEKSEKLEKEKKVSERLEKEKKVSDGLDQKRKPNDDVVVVEDVDKKSKLLIRIRGKSKEADFSDNADAKVPIVASSRELEQKVWNLRPRELVTKKKHSANAGSGGANTGSEKKSGGEVKIGGGGAVKTEMKGGSEKKGTGKGKGKEKIADFSISLTKEEIADDIYALTGSKPSRKPKKRTKLVQNQLDCLFPGMWLSTITSDTYKVDEPHQILKRALGRQ